MPRVASTTSSTDPGGGAAPPRLRLRPAVIASNARWSRSPRLSPSISPARLCPTVRGLLTTAASPPARFHGAAPLPARRQGDHLSRSTTGDGQQSRVRPLLKEGEGVTVARSDVHYVVSEYGIAYLFGRSIGRARGGVDRDRPPPLPGGAAGRGQAPPATSTSGPGSRAARLPAEEERELELKNGSGYSCVRPRPARAHDAGAVLSSCARGRVDALLHQPQVLTLESAQHLCSVSYEEEMAFVAVAGSREQESIIASGCYYLTPHQQRRRFSALLVHPGGRAWPGTILQQR